MVADCLSFVEVIIGHACTGVCGVGFSATCLSDCWTCLSQVFVVSHCLRFVGVIVGCACHRCLWCQVA